MAIAAQHILSDRAGMLGVLERSQLQSPDIRGTLESASAFCRRLQNEADAGRAWPSSSIGSNCATTVSG